MNRCSITQNIWVVFKIKMKYWTLLCLLIHVSQITYNRICEFLFFRFVCFFDLHKTSGQSTLAIHCRIIRIRDGLIFVDSIGSHKQKKKIFVIIIKKSQEFFFFNLFISIMHAFNFNRWLVIRDCQTNCLTMGDFLVH